MMHVLKKSLLCCCLGLMCTQLAAQTHDPFHPHAPEHPVPDSVLTKYPKFDQFLKSRLEFSVPIITAPELEKAMQNGQDFQILDARGSEEFQTSHLPNARRVGYDDFSVEKVWMLDRNKPVVVYCTTGIRSEQVSKYLETMGFKDVRNLYGSVIEWTNHDGRLEDAKGEETNRLFMRDPEKIQFVKNRKIKVIKGEEVKKEQ